MRHTLITRPLPHVHELTPINSPRIPTYGLGQEFATHTIYGIPTPMSCKSPTVQIYNTLFFILLSKTGKHYQVHHPIPICS